MHFKTSGRYNGVSLKLKTILCVSISSTQCLITTSDTILKLVRKDKTHLWGRITVEIKIYFKTVTKFFHAINTTMEVVVMYCLIQLHRTPNLWYKRLNLIKVLA
jgi:hypothetical protein